MNATMLPCWEKSARRFIDFVKNYPEVVRNYPEVEHETRRGKDFERLKTDLERSFLECEFSREIDQVREEISQYQRIYRRVKEVYGTDGIFHSDKFGDFLDGYLEYLGALLPVGVLVRGRIELETFKKTGLQKVKGSISKNLSTLYQNFVALSILVNFSPLEPEIIFPEQDCIYLERGGGDEKKLEPNFIIDANGKKYSFLVGGPLPFSWAPRPNIMIYTRYTEDIWRPNVVERIVRPDVIVKCVRVREWAKRTRSLAIDTWWGKFYRRAGGIVRNNRVVVNELQILKGYKEIYRPRVFFLVSKVDVPLQIRESLEDDSIAVIKNTSFVENGLNEINECMIRLDCS
ncbi:MAG: hypothetical protein WBD09_03820 [Halobacteriota archaeon]